MRTRLIVVSLAAALVTALCWAPVAARQANATGGAREGRIPVGRASLQFREVGAGQPMIVLHGGPDFDYSYLLPDFDRLADTFQLVYYDQRGRGKSADGVRPEDVSIASDVDDVDRVRRHFQLESTALLGHSWGAVLALEYALQHPTHVSHLILMNPAPASAADVAVLRKAYAQALGADLDRQREIMAGAAYQAGDPEAVAARYRLHFKSALVRPGDYEKLMAAMKAGFISQGKDGIVKARAVEDRLMHDTWDVAGYDLLPRLKQLTMPSLVITGDRDFIPVEIAARIAQAIPASRYAVLGECGHSAYLECPADIRRELDAFFRRPRVADRKR